MPRNVAYCRGTKCDTPNSCNEAGACLYRSSSEAFKEKRISHLERISSDETIQIEAFPDQVKPVRKTALPVDSAERKDIPLARGCLDYFPAALAEVARLSKAGNDKHNPGEDLHWARGKSQDHADCIMRHLAERGTIDTDGITHSAKVAWRALALLQEELEGRGAAKARGAR